MGTRTADVLVTTKGGGMILLRMGPLWLVVMALWIYCVFDVIATDEALMRNLPKPMWLIIVLIVPSVGSIAWLVLGRPEHAGFRPGDTTRRRPFSTRFVARGPDDDPNFTPWPPASASRSGAAATSDPSKESELEAWEADLARREAELNKKKGDGFEGPRW